MNKERHFKFGLPIASIMMAAAITGCSAFNPHHEIPSTIPPPPTRTATIPPTQEIVIKTDDQIVREEARRLGVLASDQERILWSTFGYTRAKEKLPINETTLKEAKSRLQSTLVLMNQSENPYFKNAANSIVLLSETSNFRISIDPNLDKTVADGQAHAFLKDGKLIYQISISANEILNNANAIGIAILVVHEDKHIRDYIEYIKSLPDSLSPQEQLEKLEQRINRLVRK